MEVGSTLKKQFKKMTFPSNGKPCKNIIYYCRRGPNIDR